MNLHSFLAQARDLDERSETLLPHAEGFHAVLGGVLLPHYATGEDWEADFGQACQPLPDEEYTQPYAREIKRSIDEFFSDHPELKSIRVKRY